MKISKLKLCYNLNLILFSSIVFGSIAGGKGVFFFDELFLVIFIIFYFLLIRLTCKFKINFFIIFLIFLLLKALISLIKLDLELKILRYCVLYFSLLTLFFLKIKETIKYDTKINILTLGVLLIILNGLLLDYTNLGDIEFNQVKYQFTEEKIVDIPRRFWTQSIFITGSTYFAIACLYLLYLISFVHSKKNLLVFLLIITLSFYYESRFIFLSCLLFLPFFFSKKNFVYFTLFLIITLFCDYYFLDKRLLEHAKEYIINYHELLNFNFQQDESRINDIKIAIEILLSNDIFTITFGSTFQSHKYLLGEYFNTNDGIYRTSTLSALIIDTGIFGLIILFLVFIELFFKIINSQKNFSLINITKTLIFIFLLILNLNLTYALENVLFFFIIGGYVKKIYILKFKK
jgi:hypothetical protein